MPKDIALELIKNSLVVIGSIVFGALLAIFYDQIGEIQYKVYKTWRKFYGWFAYHWWNWYDWASNRARNFNKPRV